MTSAALERSSLDRFRPVLDRLLAEAPGHFGGAVELEPAGFQERPFSHVLRLRVVRPGSRAPLMHLFLKMLKPKVVDGREDGLRLRLVRDFDVNKRVHDAMQPWPELGAVRPVACYPEHLAIVTEEVEGPTLLDYLERRAAWFPSDTDLAAARTTMAAVGRWLRVFQGLEDTRTDPVRIDDLVRYIDHRLQRLVEHAGARFTAADRTRVLRHLDWLGRQIAPSDLVEVPTHSDLSLGNVLVSGSRIVVLDFSMAKSGSRLHDVSRLYLQIELLGIKPRTRMRIVRELQRALLGGFDASVTAEHPLFRLLLLLHRVNHLTTLTIRRTSPAAAVYNRFVHWRHRRWMTHELGRHRPVEPV